MEQSSASPASPIPVCATKSAGLRLHHRLSFAWARRFFTPPIEARSGAPVNAEMVSA